MSASVVQIAQEPGSVVYTNAAPAVNYVAAPSATIMPAAGSVTYAAAPSATMMPGSVVYGAPVEPVGQPIQTMTYAAPTMTYAAAPQVYYEQAANQPVYTISPERFQLILAGQPLTNEEIIAMTGGSQLTGQSVVMPQQSVAGQSFAMPDMFSTPGLTNVYQATGQTQPAASVVEPTASAVVESTASAVAPTASSDKKEKKSSKKKLSSKKKEKGCC